MSEGAGYDELTLLEQGARVRLFHRAADEQREQRRCAKCGEQEGTGDLGRGLHLYGPTTHDFEPELHAFEGLSWRCSRCGHESFGHDRAQAETTYQRYQRLVREGVESEHKPEPAEREERLARIAEHYPAAAAEARAAGREPAELGW
jgi:ribosomal protein S14